MPYNARLAPPRYPHPPDAQAVPRAAPSAPPAPRTLPLPALRLFCRLTHPFCLTHNYLCCLCLPSPHRLRWHASHHLRFAAASTRVSPALPRNTLPLRARYAPAGDVRHAAYILYAHRARALCATHCSPRYYTHMRGTPAHHTPHPACTHHLLHTTLCPVPHTHTAPTRLPCTPAFTFTTHLTLAAHAHTHTHTLHHPTPATRTHAHTPPLPACTHTHRYLPHTHTTHCPPHTPPHPPHTLPCHTHGDTAATILHVPTATHLPHFPPFCVHTCPLTLPHLPLPAAALPDLPPYHLLPPPHAVPRHYPTPRARTLHTPAMLLPAVPAHYAHAPALPARTPLPAYTPRLLPLPSLPTHTAPLRARTTRRASTPLPRGARRPPPLAPPAFFYGTCARQHDALPRICAACGTCRTPYRMPCCLCLRARHLPSCRPDAAARARLPSSL